MTGMVNCTTVTSMLIIMCVNYGGIGSPVLGTKQRTRHAAGAVEEAAKDPKSVTNTLCSSFHPSPFIEHPEYDVKTWTLVKMVEL